MAVLQVLAVTPRAGDYTSHGSRHPEPSGAAGIRARERLHSAAVGVPPTPRKISARAIALPASSHPARNSHHPPRRPPSHLNQQPASGTPIPKAQRRGAGDYTRPAHRRSAPPFPPARTQLPEWRFAPATHKPPGAPSLRCPFLPCAPPGGRCRASRLRLITPPASRRSSLRSPCPPPFRHRRSYLPPIRCPVA